LLFVQGRRQFEQVPIERPQPKLLWVDLAQHLTDTWRIVLDAVQAFGPDEELVSPQRGRDQQVHQNLDGYRPTVQAHKAP
jgi:hypothetical protein